jgi:hypothetical protein
MNNNKSKEKPDWSKLHLNMTGQERDPWSELVGDADQRVKDKYDIDNISYKNNNTGRGYDRITEYEKRQREIENEQREFQKRQKTKTGGRYRKKITRTRTRTRTRKNRSARTNKRRRTRTRTRTNKHKRTRTRTRKYRHRRKGGSDTTENDPELDMALRNSEIMAADRQGITHKNVPFGELVALDHIVNTGDGSGWSPVRSRDGTPAPDGVDPILYTHFDEAGLINTPEGRQQLRDRQILHQQQKEYLQRIQEQATIAQTKKELDAIQSYGIDTTSKTPQIKPNVFDNRNKRSKK